MADINENRAGYKKTKVGWIPEAWSILNLNEIVRFKQGVQVSVEDQISDFQHGFVPFIRIINVTQKNADLRFIPDPGKAHHINFEDVFMIRYGDAGTVCIGYSGVIANNLFRLIPIKSISRNWLFMVLKFYEERIKSLAASSTMPAIKFSTLGIFKIPLPPFPEQKKIATILSTWDVAIRKLDRLIERKQTLKKGLMQQLLTGRRRFPEFVPPGGTRYRDTKLGKVPEDWEVVKLGDVVKQIKKSLDWDDSQLYKLVSVKRRSGGVFFREALYGHQIKTKTLQPIEEGDFLISKMQIVHGASALAQKEHDGMMVSSSYIILNAKDHLELDMGFFDLLSRQKWFYHLTYISSYGVHIEKMTFNFKDFLKKEIVIPSLSEQKAIDAVIRSAEREIEALQNKRDNLFQQKKGLMQQLLTGAVRVNPID